MDTLELLLHPVRLRIIHAMSGGRVRTTSDLCSRLPGVSKATVYRHVGLLADAGLLEVAGEQRVHGALERSYRLHRARSLVDRDMAASMSLEQHRHGFAAAVAALVAEFNAYLDRPLADPFADSVGYRQVALWLDPGELAEMIRALQDVVSSRLGNQPAPNRRRYLLSPILFPIEDPPKDAAGQNPEPGGAGEK